MGLLCIIISSQGLRYIVLKYIAVSSLYTWYCVEYIATGSCSQIYVFIYKITKYFSLYLQDLCVFTRYSKSVLITFLFPKRIQEVSWLIPGVTRKGLFQNVYTCTSSQWQVWLFKICAEIDLWLKFRKFTIKPHRKAWSYFLFFVKMKLQGHELKKKIISPRN